LVLLSCAGASQVRPAAAQSDSPRENIVLLTEDAPAAGLSAPPRHDRELGVVYSSGITSEGTVWTRVQAGDLTVEKQMTAAGPVSLILDHLDDHVQVRVTSESITLSRGDRSASLSNRSEARRDTTALRAILLDSRAVQTFRAFTAALERREGRDTADVLSAMLDGALVAFLDGDLVAASRIGERVMRRADAAVRRASLASAQFTDCVTAYERAILSAYRILEGCYARVGWWDYVFHYTFCSFEYFLRAEQYIFQLIACMAIP
jgi:hypothetical protein